MGAPGDTPGGGRQWQIFAVAGVVATACYTLNVTAVVSYLAFAVIGIGTVWALVAGPRRYAAEPRVAWQLLAAAALCFLLGVVIRPLAEAHPLGLMLLADGLTLLGYALTAAFLLLLLVARGSVDGLAVLDGLIVCVAGGLICALLLAAPTAAVDDDASFVPVVAAMFPLFDVVLLLLVVNLTFTTRTWPMSLVTFMATMTLLFAGDLAYAVIAVSGRSYASPLLDVPFLLGFTLLGVTALHPSSTLLGRAARGPVQAWSWRRMALIGPALASPFALLVAVGGHSAGYRVTIGVAGAVMVLLLMLRAVSAVQAQVAAQLHSEHQSRHDPLTGLPNRGMISAEIERLLTRLPAGGRQRVWVYLLDLDGFKWVNESWGHDTGDQLVLEVAARLRASVPSQHMVARVGGDEFLIVYAGDKTGALRLVEDVRGCFTRPVAVHDTELVIGASIGIAHADGAGDPGVTAEALMRDADTAMYRSKAEGPGRSTVFDTSMHDRVRERIELETALRTALADGQLSVAYQPIVTLDSGRPLGAEALVRWHHPKRGAIPPMAFIPVAEDAGMIAQIGTWVREEAFAQLARWRADGTVTDDFYLSVNVSPRQLNDPDLPLTVAAELMRHHVPARAIALEMTESVMVDGSSVTARVLFELRELGVRLLVDDFGTGFSALGYLRKFPVTGVKIDRSFVSGLGQSQEDEEIVRAVVAMSRAMGLSIVAEGVETRRQRDALAEVGVSQGQGWLWGPAVPPVDFAAHWHAAGPAAHVAATAGEARRDPGPGVGQRDQLAAGNS